MAKKFLIPDISHWQGAHNTKDFAQAARVASGFMFKATEAESYDDPEFLSNYKAARSTRLPIGAYHFVRQGHSEAQTDNFMDQMDKAGGIDFAVVDWEDGDRRTAANMVNKLQKRLAIPVIEYRGQWARAHGGDLPHADAAMVPQYGPAHLDRSYRPAHLPFFGWQYTDGVYNGTKMPKNIPGLGNVDVTRVYRAGRKLLEAK